MQARSSREGGARNDTTRVGGWLGGWVGATEMNNRPISYTQGAIDLLHAALGRSYPIEPWNTLS